MEALVLRVICDYQVALFCQQHNQKLSFKDLGAIQNEQREWSGGSGKLP